MEKSPFDQFREDSIKEIRLQAADEQLAQTTKMWMEKTARYKYSYHFEWLGRPIIQWPQDIVAMQEIIYKVKPDLIVETGIAHGGSLIFSASMLELNAICGGPADARVIGVDIDIRPHNREAIEAHPLYKRISMIEGSSIDKAIVEKIRALASGKKSVLVCLDSNHTEEHVLAELSAYAPLTTIGSYCVVFDTLVEDMPASMYPDRPWGPGDNPKTAVQKYLQQNDNFEVDRLLEQKLLLTVAPQGYLRRIA